jgi:putative FmdB family regulatory protein
MPTYEYRCENGHVFEALQSMSEDALTVCEVCGAPCQRLLSAPAIHYKGSGFYTTDYARKGKKPAAASSGSDSGSSSGSSDGGSSSSGSSDSGSKSSEKSSSTSSSSKSD